MEWFQKILESLGLKIEGDLKTKLDSADFKAALDKAIPKPEGLLTQEQFDKAIQERLKRQEKVHESELTALREDMKKLVDPSKVTEVENQFKSQLEEARKKAVALTKEMKLREALYKAGAKDIDYLMYQANQKGVVNRFNVDENGNISVVGADGKPVFGKDGKPLEFGSIVDEMKTEFGTYFGETGSSRTPGSTNPLPGFDQTKSFGQQLAEMNNGTGKSVTEGQSHYFGSGKAQ
jgi:Skp family chaperone for outer membrane proteins